RKTYGSGKLLRIVAGLDYSLTVANNDVARIARIGLRQEFRKEFIMTIQQLDLVARYQHLRQATRPITNQLIGTLSKKALQEAGKKVGILRDGVLVFDSEDDTGVLMDYCLFDFREQGMNAIERRLAHDPPPAD